MKLLDDIRQSIINVETPVVSQEAIAFQLNSKLNEGLIDLITRASAGQITPRELRTTVEKLVFDETGIYTDFIIEDIPYHNAFCRIPSLSPNHPFFITIETDIRKENYDLLAKDSIDVIKRKINNIGYVDLEKCRVSGAFSEIKTVSGFYSGMFYDDSFTPAEKAAAYIHELGHIFTTFEMAANFIIDNYALTALTSSLINTNNVASRVQIVKNAQSYLNLTNSEITEVAEVTDGKLLATILLDAKVRQARYGNRAKHYAENGQEFLADQFATRHGAGRALVTVNDKMHRLYWDEERFSAGQRVWYMFTAFVAAMTAVLITVVAAASGAYLITAFGGLMLYLFGNAVATNPLSGESYDKPSDRFKRVRNELATALKNPKISPEQKRVIIDDIKAIDELVSDMTPYFTLWEKIGLVLFSSHRKTLDLRNTEQQLEKIGANDLFVKSAEFSIV